MKKLQIISVSLGVLVVLGLPPAVMLTADNPSGPALTPMEQLLASRSTLEGFYKEWESRYVQAGGDRQVRFGLGNSTDLSSEIVQAHGMVKADLIGGSVEVEVEGLEGPADVWLLDNQPGPGRTALPEPGDRMIHLGRLEGGAVSRTTAVLGQEFFKDFELDWVVVSRAGQNPVESRVLLGTRSFFERLHTRTRQSQENVAAARTNLLRPDALLSWLTAPVAEANSSTILVSHGLVSQQVAKGGDLFFRGTFKGNSRTCGTCHPVDNNQTIEPAFIATLPANDPLFVAEPGHPNHVPGLERPALMRGFGLILENVDGGENPTVKFTMRGVPHSLSVATSVTSDGSNPNFLQRTGWSGDGAPPPGTIRMFSLGAVNQHFPKTLNRVNGVDFQFPTDAELDAMEAFMFSVGRLNELTLSAVLLNNAQAESGRQLFLAPANRCNGCHANAGANVASGINFNFNTGVERVPNPAQQVESFPLDGGFGGQGLNAPNFDCDGDNILDCFGNGQFNTTPVIEAADTGPFFHNDVSETIEDAVEFYTTSFFRNSPVGGAGINLTAQQIADIGAFLRVINSGFNLAISIQRNQAALQLENSSGFSESLTGGEDFDNVNGKRATVNALLSLANAEGVDVLEALGNIPTGPIHSDVRGLVNEAISLNNQAIASNASQTRKKLINSALSRFQSAKNLLGTGLNFVMGEGNLMF